MRRIVVGLALAFGCDAPVDPVDAYLDDAAHRRAELVASLTVTTNDYARLRLARYDSGDARDWSLLPAWNPPAAPLSPADAPLRSLDIGARDEASLRALGALAFSRYPAMLASPWVESTLRAGAERYGLWRADDGSIGGVVRVTLGDGSTGLAYTCATCHAARDRAGSLTMGLANAALDLGALGADHNPTLPAASIAALRAWGPGRVDVTTTTGAEPVAIPDLRPVREQAFLQRAGAVRRRSVTSLAIRVETLLVTSLGETVRPPREVALGLALYLDSLADTLPPVPRDHPGAAVFAARCAACHAPPTYGGGLVAPEAVGSDPALALSPTRGTGAYRVPSLRGVGARGALLHDGSVADLDALLDPTRAAGGHRFGAELGAADAALLRGFLSAL